MVELNRTSLLLTAALTAALTSCASNSMTFVSPDGKIGTCATSGMGLVGSIQAQGVYERCVAAASAAGYIRTEEAGSIGVMAGPDPSSAGILNVIPGSPADLAGIKPGDQIVAIDDQPVKNWPDARRLVFGRVNTPVKVMYRSGGLDRTANLIRYPFVSVPGGM